VLFGSLYMWMWCDVECLRFTRVVHWHGMKLTFYRDWLIFHGPSAHACMHVILSCLHEWTSFTSWFWFSISSKKKCPLNWPVRGAGIGRSSAWYEIMRCWIIHPSVDSYSSAGSISTNHITVNTEHSTGGGALKSKDGQRQQGTDYLQGYYNARTSKKK
jgi:hypothetical protein